MSVRSFHPSRWYPCPIPLYETWNPDSDVFVMHQVEESSKNIHGTLWIGSQHLLPGYPSSEPPLHSLDLFPSKFSGLRDDMQSTPRTTPGDAVIKNGAHIREPEDAGPSWPRLEEALKEGTKEESRQGRAMDVAPIRTVSPARPALNVSFQWPDGDSPGRESHSGAPGDPSLHTIS
jgi:hypothetical protein